MNHVVGLGKPQVILILILLVVNGFISPNPRPVIADGPYEIMVDASKDWQATGVAVRAGEQVTITYVGGQWRTNPQDDWHGADGGSSYPCSWGGCVASISGLSKGSLIGRIGNGAPFAIGYRTRQIAPERGTLFVRSNDLTEGLMDNAGRLTIRVERASPADAVETADTMVKTVFAVAYLDATPTYDVEVLHQQVIDALHYASIWHGYARPDGTPALDYRTYQDEIVFINEVPPYRTDNDKFDYAGVYERFGLCELVQAGEIDEVWVWESGTGHAWEWVTNGPAWEWVLDSNVPDCGRTVTTMNLNYQVDVGYALHSFGHRFEGAVMTHNPCVFYTETWPWINWPFECRGKVSDIYSYVARPFDGNNQVGVCGDVHHPPNITDDREYIYDDRTYVDSICQDWHMDGSAHTTEINCETWHCTHAGYLIWWLQNLPGIDNNGRYADGTPMENWWAYLFE